MTLGIALGGENDTSEHKAICKMWAHHKCVQAHNNDPLWSLPFLIGHAIKFAFLPLVSNELVFPQFSYDAKPLFQRGDCQNYSQCV